MPICITVAENSQVASSSPDLPEGVVGLPDTTFQALRRVAFNGEGADSLLHFFVQKGREYIRFQNYVGLLALPDGTQIEILPKIQSDLDARSTMLTMLRYLRHSPFRTLTPAHTQAAHLPLWEVFITAFVDSVESLVRQGIRRAYVGVERNERFWKGRFQATRQQRENGQHAERLAVAFDWLTADVPPNRILKTALLHLSSRSISAPVQRRIRRLLQALDDVPISDSLADDLRASQRVNRLFNSYEPALRWAVALLQGRAFGVKIGSVMDISLLVPMGRVFEDFVAHGIRTYWPETGAVTVQEASAHLVDQHVGTPKFRLRPDILIRQGDRTLVLDTKWKRIDGHDRTGNYGIEQADLYQLYAYGKKYAASDLFLVYPANETFRHPLAVFGYDASTRLHVVPFNVASPLVNEVEKLARYALSVQDA
ncbi:McrC family protein [Spirosoma taeanense]|uniref:McrC family protein n=1 Tax=Spirosoma taeanense TaxID=2735870 RepID=A0A6M5Y8R8_9BACT|nr:McrC family protein [Spirosoma taeanense]QJW90688.1 McrC family protein [Spirosoma taeanense]